MPRGSRRIPDACVERMRASRPRDPRGRHRHARGARRHRGDRAAGRTRCTATSTRPTCAASCPRRARSTRTARGSRSCTTRARAPAGSTRMRKRFPDADAVVFGHSHIPLHETTRRRRLPDLQPRQPDRAPPAAAPHDGHRPRPATAQSPSSWSLWTDGPRRRLPGHGRIGPVARAAALPATLIRRGGDRLLFDCGEGTQRQLLRSTGLRRPGGGLPDPLPRRPLPRPARDDQVVQPARARAAADRLRAARAEGAVRRC